jgi:hypothetical protein
MSRKLPGVRTEIAGDQFPPNWGFQGVCGASRFPAYRYLLLGVKRTSRGRRQYNLLIDPKTRLRFVPRDPAHHRVDAWHVPSGRLVRSRLGLRRGQ